MVLKKAFEVSEMIYIKSVGKNSLWYCKWFGSAFLLAFFMNF